MRGSSALRRGHPGELADFLDYMTDVLAAT